MNDVLFQLSKNLFFLFISLMLYFSFVLLVAHYPIEGLDPDSDKQFQQKKFQNFNFVAAGDFGCGDEPNRTVNGMTKKNPELVIALGDLSYEKSATCWLNSVLPLDIDGKIKVTFGHHDLNKNLTKYNVYLKHFNMTKPYYSFNYQNVHFLAMATGKDRIIPYRNGSEQYSFIEQDLRNAHTNRSIDWVIVYSSRPSYSSLTEHGGQQVLSETYHPLFDAYGVDIVLQAHNHNYQRTFPLIYNENSYSPLLHPIIGDKHSDEYKDPKGTIFLTVGTGGAELDNFKGIVPYVVEQFASHGFLNVDMDSSSNSLRLSGTFYENMNMNKKDHFNIIKERIPE